MRLILDTNFIITAEREARRRQPERTDVFFAAHPEDYFYITFTIAGELACGRSASAKEDWEHLCSPYPVIPWSNEISWRYGEIYRQLAKSGNLIGTNDLWIAATALVHGMPIVTQNIREFERVEGLDLLSY